MRTTDILRLFTGVVAHSLLSRDGVMKCGFRFPPVRPMAGLGNVPVRFPLARLLTPVHCGGIYHRFGPLPECFVPLSAPSPPPCTLVVGLANVPSTHCVLRPHPLALLWRNIPVHFQLTLRRACAIRALCGGLSNVPVHLQLTHSVCCVLTRLHYCGGHSCPLATDAAAPGTERILCGAGRQTISRALHPQAGDGHRTGLDFPLFFLNMDFVSRVLCVCVCVCVCLCVFLL